MVICFFQRILFLKQNIELKNIVLIELIYQQGMISAINIGVYISDYNETVQKCRLMELRDQKIATLRLFQNKDTASSEWMLQLYR